MNYNVENISAEDVIFAIYSPIEINRTRVFHLELGTIGFTRFNSAEYLEEILRSFITPGQREEPSKSMSRRSRD